METGTGAAGIRESTSRVFVGRLRMPRNVARVVLLLVTVALAYAQNEQVPASNAWKPTRGSNTQSDLAWLIGSWRIEKHYSPDPFMKGKNLVETEQCACCKL